MLTEVIKIDANNPQAQVIQKAADYIRAGKLVAVPTETVYGLAADADNRDSLMRLYEIKKRPADKPFAVCISSVGSAEKLASDIPPLAYRLMEKFWPGPLTLVLKAKNGKTIGLRMPDDRVALQIIEHSASLIAFPSANISPSPAPVSSKEVLKDLDGLIELVIDAGPTRLKMESTVLDASSKEIQVLREGALKKQDLEKIARGKRVLFVCTGNSCRSVMAQGLLSKVLKEKGRDDVEALSCGISALFSIGPTRETLDLLARENIDMSGYRSRQVDRMLLKGSDLIFPMEDIHRRRIIDFAPEVENRVYLLKEFAKIAGNDINVADPIGRGEDFYTKTLCEIKQAVERIAEII